jgi:hypothetical protein
VTHGTSLLGQVFKMRPRAPIESLDHAYGTGDYAYGTGRPSRVLSRWSPFGTLVFAPPAPIPQHWRRTSTAPSVYIDMAAFTD